MKKNILLIAASIFSLSVLAEVPVPVTIDGFSVIKLNAISSNNISFVVHAPGSVSGICELIIRSTGADDALKKLADRFYFTENVVNSLEESQAMTPFSSRYGIHLKLTNKGAFLDDMVTITAQDGRGIDENIKALFSRPDGHLGEVAILAGMCNVDEK